MAADQKPKALIVGAGIAGLATAWWLDKAGWSSIVVEKAPDIRSGGYNLGLTGACIRTLQEMDLLEQVKEIANDFGYNTNMDPHGRVLMRLRYKDIHPDHGAYSVGRDDLVRLLWEALPQSASVRFSETVDTAEEEEDGVAVTLKKSGESVKVDLLVGADGIRSAVRGMFWKDEDYSLEDLGYFYSVYSVEQIGEASADVVSFNSPGHLDALYSRRNHRLAVLHVWREDHYKHVNSKDPGARFETLRRVNADGAPQVLQVIDAAEKAQVSPLIDTLTLVKMPQWSKGRVLLVGDAAHCLTLLSGQGAGMAIVSAGILGKKLMASTGGGGGSGSSSSSSRNSRNSLSEALESHERQLRPLIEKLQTRGHKVAAWYISKSRFWYWVRNTMIKLMPYSWLVSWLIKATKVEAALTLDGGEQE